MTEISYRMLRTWSKKSCALGKQVSWLVCVCVGGGGVGVGHHARLSSQLFRLKTVTYCTNYTVLKRALSSICWIKFNVRLVFVNEYRRWNTTVNDNIAIINLEYITAPKTLLIFNILELDTSNRTTCIVYVQVKAHLQCSLEYQVIL